MTRHLPGSEQLEPILAGGGIVAGAQAEIGKIALVRRSRYAGETGLPKGKVKTEEGETIVRAAEREVCEEIGYEVRATAFAGLTSYLVSGRPKVVFYYRMELLGGGRSDIDSSEIESIAWVTPEEAVAKLTHAEDRHLIERIFKLMRG